MSNLSLYEYARQLSDQILLMEQAIAEGDASKINEIEQRISDLLLGESEKVDRCTAFIRYCEAQQDAIKEEIKRLGVVSDRIDAAKNRMLVLAGKIMLERNQDLEGNNSKFSFRKSSQLKVYDQDKIPEKYLKVSQTISVDKVRVKEAIKLGEDVPGCILEEIKNVVIK